MKLRARIPGALSATLTFVGLVLALSGLPLVFLWIAALGASSLLLSRRLSVGMTLSVATIGFLLVEHAVLVTGSLGGPGILLTQCVVWSVIGLGAGIASALVPAPTRSWTRTDRWLALAAASGALVTLLVTIVGAALPGAVHLAWAMNDDAVRDLLDLRQIIASHGTASTPGDPTPLPFGVSAANALPGRAAVPSAQVLRFDITRMAEVWIAVAAASCLILGAIAARALRGVRAWIAIPLTVTVSLAGLSWWVIGIQLADGYLNAGFATALLLAAWLAFLESDRRPGLALVALCAAAIVMLPIWSPMVICVAALALVVLARLLSRSSARLAKIVLGALGLLAVSAALSLGFLAAALRSNDLSADGGFPEISTPIVFALLLLVLVVLVVDALRVGLRHLASGAIALAIAGIIGIAYLVYQRRESADPLGYYPEKFSWLMVVLLAVVGLTVLSELLKHRPIAGRAPRAILTSIMVVAVGVAIVASWAAAPERVSPAFGILSGQVFGVGDADADRVFDRVERGGTPAPGASRGDRGEDWVNYYVDRFLGGTKRR